MFSVPFLGSEGLSPESCNRFRAGLEVAAFTVVPTTKLDMGRLTSKRQCNHIYSIQQENLVSLCFVAGKWHGYAKTLVAEQVFNGLKQSLEGMDVVKQSQKVPKIQFLTGGKPSVLNSSRPKLPIQNFDEQLAVLERIRLQSQALCNGSEYSEQSQVSHKFNTRSDQQTGNFHSMLWSEKQASTSPDDLFQQSLEKQFTGVQPPGSCVDGIDAGPVCTKQMAEVNFTGHQPVWNEAFLEGPRGQAGKSRVFSRPLPLSSNEQTSPPRNEPTVNLSSHPKVTICDTSNEVRVELQSSAQNIDVCHVGRELHGSVQCLDRVKKLMNGKLTGSLNTTNVNDIYLRKQVYRGECPNADADVLSSTIVEGMQAKDATCTGASSSSCKIASVRMPKYRMATPLQRSLSNSILYLESLGVDCSRLFRDDPTTMKCTVKQLRTLVCALERHGLKSNDYGRLFNLCPKILHVKPDGDLKAVTGFLFDEAGLLRKDFGKVIRRCPRLLVADIQEQLRPTLSFLRSLGYAKMGQVISNNPTLLSFSVERKLIPKLKFLESLGFSYREASSMVVRFPAIFNYSISDNLRPKYDYLVHEMNGNNKDLLAFPQYFGYSLETRIRPRHKCIDKLGVPLSIQAILKLSDVEFNARFLCGGGQDCPYFTLPPQMCNSTMQDCGLDSLQFASFEQTELRALVSVKG